MTMTANDLEQRARFGMSPALRRYIVEKHGPSSRTPAFDYREARRQEVDEALAILEAASNVRMTVTVRHSVCWCLDGEHHLMDRADTESAGEAVQLAERMARHQPVHRLHYRDVQAVIREEVES